MAVDVHDRQAQHERVMSAEMLRASQEMLDLVEQRYRRALESWLESESRSDSESESELESDVDLFSDVDADERADTDADPHASAEAHGSSDECDYYGDVLANTATSAYELELYDALFPGKRMASLLATQEPTGKATTRKASAETEEPTRVRETDAHSESAHESEVERERDLVVALAVASELEQELAHSEDCNAQLSEKVQSLERMMAAQREQLESMRQAMDECNAERLSLRSEVARGEADKRELERQVDELSARVWVLEVTEANLRHELFVEIEDKAIMMSNYDAKQRQHEERVELLQSQVLGMKSLLCTADQPQDEASAQLKPTHSTAASTALAAVEARPSTTLPRRQSRTSATVPPKSFPTVLARRSNPLGTLAHAKTARAYSVASVVATGGSRLGKGVPVAIPVTVPMAGRATASSETKATDTDHPTAACPTTKQQHQQQTRTAARVSAKQKLSHILPSASVAATTETTMMTKTPVTRAAAQTKARKKSLAKAPARPRWC